MASVRSQYPHLAASKTPLQTLQTLALLCLVTSCNLWESTCSRTLKKPPLSGPELQQRCLICSRLQSQVQHADGGTQVGNLRVLVVLTGVLPRVLL
ncbi:hypothetical protein C8R46DRAFT_1117136, partial [Mycena filopes]